MVLRAVLHTLPFQCWGAPQRPSITRSAPGLPNNRAVAASLDGAAHINLSRVAPGTFPSLLLEGKRKAGWILLGFHGKGHNLCTHSWHLSVP